MKICTLAIERANELAQLGKTTTAQHYRLYGSRWRNDMGDLSINRLSRSHIIQWKDKMLAKGYARNTVNFYLRGLKALYNRAVMLEYTKDHTPFKMIACGNVKTAKRAITQKALLYIANITLPDKKDDLARDMFMLSFYLRGMPPIDLARLTTDNVYTDNFIRYKRSKTSQELTIAIEPQAKAILRKHQNWCKGNKLTPISSIGGWGTINQSLHKIGVMAKVPFPLTMYCARHTWATLSQQIGTPIEVISSGLGHTNVQTTSIYLASIETSTIDKYNHNLIKKLQL